MEGRGVSVSWDGRGEVDSYDGLVRSSNGCGCGMTIAFGSSGDNDDFRGGGIEMAARDVDSSSSSSSTSVVTARALDERGAVCPALISLPLCTGLGEYWDAGLSVL